MLEGRLLCTSDFQKCTRSLSTKQQPPGKHRSAHELHSWSHIPQRSSKKCTYELGVAERIWTHELVDIKRPRLNHFATEIFHVFQSHSRRIFCCHSPGLQSAACRDLWMSGANSNETPSLDVPTVPPLVVFHYELFWWMPDDVPARISFYHIVRGGDHLSCPGGGSYLSYRGWGPHDFR